MTELIHYCHSLQVFILIVYNNSSVISRCDYNTSYFYRFLYALLLLCVCKIKMIVLPLPLHRSITGNSIENFVPFKNVKTQHTTGWLDDCTSKTTKTQCNIIHISVNILYIYFKNNGTYNFILYLYTFERGEERRLTASLTQRGEILAIVHLGGRDLAARRRALLDRRGLLARRSASAPAASPAPAPARAAAPRVVIERELDA